MSDFFIFDQTTNLLGKALKVSSKRHSLIAGNIANMDTVGFQPRDLDFHKTLAKELKRSPGSMAQTHAKHFAQTRSGTNDVTIRTSPAGAGTPDAVNIDTEMTSLMENNLKYRSSVELLLRKINLLRQAITEGGR